MTATQDFPLPECSGFFYVRPQDAASLSDHTCFHMRQESDEGRNLLPFQMRMVGNIFFCEALQSYATFSSTLIILSLCHMVKLYPTSDSVHISFAKFAAPLERMFHQNQLGHKLNSKWTKFLFLSLIYFSWKP